MGTVSKYGKKFLCLKSLSLTFSMSNGLMKRLPRIPTLFVAVLISAATMQAAVITRVTAGPTSLGKIKVEWKTEDETGVLRFEIFRAQVTGDREPRQEDFLRISRDEGIAPKGSPQEYEFIDEEMYKSASEVFAYKVRVVFQNGTYSDSEMIKTPRPSGTTNIGRRTWGSIKALFR